MDLSILSSKSPSHNSNSMKKNIILLNPLSKKTSLLPLNSKRDTESRCDSDRLQVSLASKFIEPLALKNEGISHKLKEIKMPKVVSSPSINLNNISNYTSKANGNTSYYLVEAKRKHDE